MKGFGVDLKFGQNNSVDRRRIIVVNTGNSDPQFAHARNRYVAKVRAEQRVAYGWLGGWTERRVEARGRGLCDFLPVWLEGYAAMTILTDVLSLFPPDIPGLEPTAAR